MHKAVASIDRERGGECPNVVSWHLEFKDQPSNAWDKPPLLGRRQLGATILICAIVTLPRTSHRT